MSLSPQQVVLEGPWALLGDPHPLVEQLGATAAHADDSLNGVAAETRHLQAIPSLPGFLKYYHSQLLLPLEMPAILRAHHRAERGETRELIELEHALAAHPQFTEFAGASRRAGRTQLHRLRTLRDHRCVQRYLAAVEAGTAQGFHLLAYGLTLAVFSLPLRQGLIHYARQTLQGFLANSRARNGELAESRRLIESLEEGLPVEVERLLRETATPRLEVR